MVLGRLDYAGSWMEMAVQQRHWCEEWAKSETKELVMQRATPTDEDRAEWVKIW